MPLQISYLSLPFHGDWDQRRGKGGAVFLLPVLLQPSLTYASCSHQGDSRESQKDLGSLEVFKQSLNYLRFSSMGQKMHALGKFYHSESLNPCHMSEDRKLLNTCMDLLSFSFKILSQSNNLIFIVKPCMKSECVPTSALLVLQNGWSVKSVEIFWQYFSIKKRSWHIASTS